MKSAKRGGRSERRKGKGNRQECGGSRNEGGMEERGKSGLFKRGVLGYASESFAWISDKTGNLFMVERRK